MLKGLIGKKIGMTQIFDETRCRLYPVTLIEAGPCYVTQVRTPGEGRLFGSAAWFQRGAPQASDRRRTGSPQRKQDCLRCVSCVNSAPKTPDVKVGDKLTVEVFARRRTRGCDRRQQGQGFCRCGQTLSFPRVAADARHVRSQPRARFERLRHHSRSCLSRFAVAPVTWAWSVSPLRI